MAVSLATRTMVDVKLDRDPSSKYPHGLAGARRLVRRRGKAALARDVRRGEV